METVVQQVTEEHQTLGIDDIVNVGPEEKKPDLNDERINDISKTVESSREDYQKLNGQYASLKGQFKSMNDNQKQLMQMNERLLKENEALKERVPRNEMDFLTPDEAKSIEHTRPVFDKYQNHAAETILETVDQQFAKVQSDTDERVKTMQEQNYRGLVRFAHSDVEEVNMSEEFSEFVLKREPFSGRTYGELLQDSINNYDSEHTIAWYNKFKEAHPESFQKKIPVTEPAPHGAEVEAGSNKPLIKESTYQDAFDKWARKKTMPTEDFDKFKVVYNKAEKEGRILYGQ